MKNIFFVMITLLLINTNIYSVEASNNHDLKVLGIEKNVWYINLNSLKGISFSNDFLNKIKENENDLKLKKDTEFFQKLNSKNNLMSKHKDSDLLKLKQTKLKSSYITDLSLNNNNFFKVIEYIPLLNKSYNEDEIAKFLPYIALAINSDMKDSEINYYVKYDIDSNINIDIATFRLYNIVIESIK